MAFAAEGESFFEADLRYNGTAEGAGTYTVIVTYYKDKGGTLEIPAKVIHNTIGYSVTSIGQGAVFLRVSNYIDRL